MLRRYISVTGMKKRTEGRSGEQEIDRFLLYEVAVAAVKLLQGASSEGIDSVVMVRS